MSGWVAPIGCSRRGASHARRDRPCQDASACRQLWSADGQPVLVMAVADGHGASRHPHSDWGSRLACEQAIAAVESSLGKRRLSGAAQRADQSPPGDWLIWLREELPARIHSGWLQATQQHWQDSGGSGRFSPEPYGTTLGLVVMTPHWWGRTGLGDWDLVQINDTGLARLIDQEGPLASGGETTLSLCLDQAALLCSHRAALQPIRQGDGAFSLMLCTDGIRKSCASDADFLTLAAWLSLAISAPGGREGPGSSPDAPDLATALDRISREGSGDDVSLTLAHWTPGATPSPAAAIAPGPALAHPRGRTAPAIDAVPLAVPLGAPPEPANTQPAQQPRRRWLRLGLILLAGAAAGAWLLSPPAAQLPPPPRSGVVHSPERRALLEEIERLCHRPERIGRTLARRQQLFEDLASGQRPSGPQKAEAIRDPLGALIAVSQGRNRSSGQVVSPVRPLLPLPGECAPLTAALAHQWLQHARRP